MSHLLWIDGSYSIEISYETTINFSKEEMERMEIRSFVNKGLRDMYYGRLLDFATTFEALEGYSYLAKLSFK